MNSLLPSLRRSFLLPIALGLLAAVTLRADPASDLTAARTELESLKQKYTETHPRVKEVQARIAALEKQVNGAGPQQVPGFPLMNVDFPGGTIADLVALLARNPDAHFNLIGEKEDMSTPLPPFAVRNTTPSMLAGALMQLLGPRGLVVAPGGGGPVGVDPVFVLVKQGHGITPVAFESFQVGPYLETLTIDDITTAVRSAWEMNPAHKPEALQLKYHPSTKLLLASGSPEATQLAGKVIASLPKPEKRPPLK